MTHSRPLTLPWPRPASSTPSSTTSTMFPWPRSQHWPPEMPPAVCSAECKFVAISPFSQSLIWKRPDQLLLAGLFLFFGRRTVHSRIYGSRRARFAAWTLCSFKLCPFARAAGARVWRFPQCRRAHHRRHTALPGRARACQTVRAACRGAGMQTQALLPSRCAP